MARQLLLGLLAVAVMCLAAVVSGQEQQQQQQQGRRPFSRLQATTRQAARSAQEVDPAAAAAGGGSTAAEEEDEFTKPTDKASYLLNLTQNGADPLEMLSAAVKSRGFKALLANVEIQHRILEEIPLLESIDGFRELKQGGRRLSAEESAGLFQRGMDSLLAFAADSVQKNKKPEMAAATIAKMAASKDPAMQALFKRVQAGDPSAVEALQDVFAKEHYSGLDHATFRKAAQSLTAERRLQAIPEIMYFIDKDPTLSSFFRNPVTAEGIQEFAAGFQPKQQAEPQAEPQAA